MGSEQDYDVMYKVVLTGDSGVGKSSILNQFVHKEFNPNNKATIGVEFATYFTEIDGKKVMTQIWDTAGQERYRAVTNLYYRKAKGVLLVFDISTHSSFRNLTRWLQEAQTHASPDAVISLVGNKSDLRHLRTVTREEAQKFAQKNNLNYIETSALDTQNIESACVNIIEEMHQSHVFAELDSQGVGGNGTKLNDGPKDEPIRVQSKPKKDKFKVSCCGAG